MLASVKGSVQSRLPSLLPCSESGPPGVVHLSRHEWQGRLVHRYLLSCHAPCVVPGGGLLASVWGLSYRGMSIMINTPPPYDHGRALGIGLL